jgi:hypothetical protein
MPFRDATTDTPRRAVRMAWKDGVMPRVLRSKGAVPWAAAGSYRRVMDLPITGGCGCGVVRFEISEPLLGAAYCHCTRCQRRTGAGASATARAEPGSVTITQGEDALRWWAPEGGREKVFCAHCGSALFSRVPGTTDNTGVRLGAIDGDPGVRPDSHQFVAYAARWEPIPDDGLPRYLEARPGYADGR